MKKTIITISIIMFIVFISIFVVKKFDINVTSSLNKNNNVILFEDYIKDEKVQLAIANELNETYGENYLEVISKNIESSSNAKKINDLILASNARSSSYPSYYGGQYINDNQELVLQITENEKDFKNNSIYQKINEINNDIVYETIEYSYNELEEVYNSITTKLDEEVYLGWYGYYIDVMNNRVVVELENLDKINDFKKNIINSEIIHFVEGKKPLATATYNIGSPLKDSLGNNFCSMGFRAKYNGNAGIVTAGHCVVANQVLPFGNVQVRKFSGSVDAAFIKSSHTLTNNLNYQTYPNTTITTNTTMPYLVAGSLLGKVGYKSGAVTGSLISLSYTTTYNYKNSSGNTSSVRLTDLGYADLDNRQGDSGGGVFTYSTSSNSSASLVGITSGGVFTVDENGNITNDVSSVTYFSKLNNILSSLGVTRY